MASQGANAWRDAPVITVNDPSEPSYTENYTFDGYSTESIPPYGHPEQYPWWYGDNISRTAWWRFTPPRTAYYTFDTSASYPAAGSLWWNPDTIVGVWRDDGTDYLELVDYGDDTTYDYSNYAASPTALCRAGETYYVQVGCYSVTGNANNLPGYYVLEISDAPIEWWVVGGALIDAQGQYENECQIAALSNDRCLIVYPVARPEWHEGEFQPTIYRDDTIHARVITAGDPPTAGPVANLIDMADYRVWPLGSEWEDPPGDTAQAGEDGWTYSLVPLGNERFLYSFIIVTYDNERTGVALLAVDGDTVSVLDVYTQPASYGASLLSSAGEDKAVWAHVDESGDVGMIRVVTVSGDSLTVHTPVTLQYGLVPELGLWCNESVGVVMGYVDGALSPPANAWAHPFKVNGTSIDMGTPTTIEGLTSTDVTPVWLEASHPLPDGPLPNTFMAQLYVPNAIAPTVDHADDYLMPSILETDGEAMLRLVQGGTTTDESFAIIGNTQLAVLTTLPDGTVSQVFSGSSWRRHGHEHKYYPVLMMDVMADLPHDQVHEVPFPWNGGMKYFQNVVSDDYSSEVWSRNVVPTETGLFVSLSHRMYFDEPVQYTYIHPRTGSTISGSVGSSYGHVVFWASPLPPPIDGEPLDNRRRFATGR